MVKRGSVGTRSTLREPSSLAAEVRLVDRARRALTASDFSVAHRLIQRYRDEFPEGALTADVAFIQIKVLKAQGNEATWRAHANRFLETFPRDPHCERVLRALKGTDEP